MPVAVACPGPPLLVPGVAGTTAPEVDELRAACQAAVRAVVHDARRSPVPPAARAGDANGHLDEPPAGVTLVAVVPGPPGTPVDGRPWRLDAAGPGTLSGIGVDVPAADRPDPDGADRPPLPTSATVGRWLLRDAGWTGRVDLLVLPATATPGTCLRLGAELAGRPLLVVADGSNRRGPKPPGGPHPDADAVDRDVARALAAGDAGALERLDATRYAAAGCEGRAGWQVLAGWARTRSPAVRAAPGGVRAEVLHDAAPFGVGYLVASWTV
ncbi:class III extradiol ring-cleavage dioxygenase family protein [Thalassiella azotivora]